jgi:uncharacterized integral membrane protein
MDIFVIVVFFYGVLVGILIGALYMGKKIRKFLEEK